MSTRKKSKTKKETSKGLRTQDFYALVSRVVPLRSNARALYGDADELDTGADTQSSTSKRKRARKEAPAEPAAEAQSTPSTPAAKRPLPTTNSSIVDKPQADVLQLLQAYGRLQGRLVMEVLRVAASMACGEISSALLPPTADLPYFATRFARPGQPYEIHWAIASLLIHWHDPVSATFDRDKTLKTWRGKLAFLTGGTVAYLDTLSDRNLQRLEKAQTVSSGAAVSFECTSI